MNRYMGLNFMEFSSLKKIFLTTAFLSTIFFNFIQRTFLLTEKVLWEKEAILYQGAVLLKNRAYLK